jgi:cell wall-associated NlpC family hydrolase
MGIEAPAPLEADRDTSAQRGLDAFRALASPTYHVPGEGDVTVAAPFRMPHAPQVASSTPVDAVTARYAATEARVVAHQPELRALATKLGVQDLYAVSIGHASPETVRRLTQGLIDAGRLPPSDGHTPTAVRVRTMMSDYGLGFDCAGYVQRAFLAARGLTRAQAGFASGTAVESLGDLPAKGFVKVAPESARPGDIVVLDAAPGGGPGHRLVVHDRREPSAAEVASLALRSNGVPLTPGRVSAIQVDSSFGSGGMPQVGGVGSRTWLYDAASQQWAPDTGGPLVFSSRPYYGDSLRGIYHFPGKH